MEKLIVVKFGGSAIGKNGEGLPTILQRIKQLKEGSKIIAVCSAPLSSDTGRSLTDIMLNLGKSAAKNENYTTIAIEETYSKILEMVNDDYKEECKKIIHDMLVLASKSLEDAKSVGKFEDETRAKSLAYSGEVLMSHVLNFVLKSNGIKSETISLDDWPIITDENIESTNFLFAKSNERIKKLEDLIKQNDVVTIGGFIGKTEDGIITTYERGGSDRTAADIGILFHKKYDTKIDLEKDSSVVSADPKIVQDELDQISDLSYNEARLAGMFGMKIIDPIAIKEIVENGVEISVVITDMNKPEHITTIQRKPTDKNGHPLKIVTGKKNCAILRIESSSAKNLLESLEREKRYSEFIILSPFTKDGMEFTRILFLDADYVNRNEKYVLSFDSLANISYQRGVITLIGDEMWRVQQIASKASSKVGDAGLNILNLDAQEETSRIIIVIEDSDDNVAKGIAAIHSERSKIKFI